MRRIALAFALGLAVPLFAAGTFTVTNINDSGPGSLRQAILDANAAEGGAILFAIGSGVRTIQPQTALPLVQHSTTIDGTTQPGYDGQPLIELDGALLDLDFQGVKDGLVLNGPSTVRGLAVSNFGWTGISLGGGSHVSDCRFGFAPGGQQEGRNGTGLHMSGGIVERNQFARSRFHGLRVSPAGTTIVRDNVFAANVLDDPGQSQVLVQYQYSERHRTTIENNVIGGAGSGIWLRDTTNVTIHGNHIGVTASGEALPNLGAGVAIYNSTDVWVVGNVIRNSRSSAVFSQLGTMRAYVLNNSISDNQFGIDLAPQGWETPNDADDTDEGPNNLINFPTVDRVRSGAATTTIEGSLSSLPNREYTIELFHNGRCNGRGHGEGKLRIDTFTVTTDASGTASFTRVLAGLDLAGGSAVTATSTQMVEGTSEFSPCATVEGPGFFTVPISHSLEEGQSGTIAVTRTGGTVGPATVRYELVSLGATPGTDYVDHGGILEFADGEATKNVTVTTVEDSLDERTQYFGLQIFAPTGAQLGNRTRAHILILDDDPLPAMTGNDVVVDEGDAGRTVVEFRLTLSAPSERSIHFAYETMSPPNGAIPDVDYEHIYIEDFFAAGETEKTITVTVLGDREWEPDETFWVVFGAEGPHREPLYGTIRNDDPQPVRVTPERMSIPAGKTHHAAIELDMPALAPLTFHLTSSAPEAVSVPAEIHVAGGELGAQIPIEALLPNRTAEITITSPGYDHPFVIRVSTYTEVELRFSSERFDLGIGETRTLLASLFPAQSEPVTVHLEAGGNVSAPAQIVIPPGGEAWFAITGHTPGPFVVTGTLPQLYRREKFSVTGQVRTGPAPAVENVTPSSGSMGGDTLALITGRNFTVNCWPFFGGAPARGAIVRNPASITAVTPPYGAGTVDVQVRCTGGSATLPDAFTYTAADDPLPQIGDVVPLTGRPGDVLRLTGTRFRADATVRVGDLPARILDATPESYMIVIPEVEPGPAAVSIHLGGQLASTTGPILTILPATPPSVTGAVPYRVAAGAEVTLTGVRFPDGYGFTVSGRPAAIVSIPTPYRAVIRVPADLGVGVHRVNVVNAAGAVVSTGPTIAVTEEGLRVLTVTPSCANVDGGTLVTITGTGFGNGAMVTFDGSQSADVEVVDETTIITRVPANIAGGATIAVHNTDETFNTLTGAFRYASSFDPDGCTASRTRSIAK